MKDLEFMGKLVKQVGRSPADKFAGSKFEQPAGWPVGRRAGSPK